MTERWDITTPGNKAFPWEGSINVVGGSLALLKFGLAHPTRIFAPGNWSEAKRTSEDPEHFTSDEVAAIAGRGLADPESLTVDEIQSVCASFLSGRVGE